MPGARVRVRGRSWLVTGVAEYESCLGVRLAPEPPGGSSACTLILPFDRLRPDETTRSRWRREHAARAAKGLASRVLEASLLRSVPRLNPALAMPAWQLVVPAIFAAGRATRVLLADAVGLGKTVQAGFTLAAMQSAAADRARTLVLTPAALRDQWLGELERLFGLSAEILDAATIRRLRRELPPDVNPWAMPRVAIASLDFVKQPEVLGAALAASWDLLVVDEAHHLGPGTDRYAAAHAIGRRVPLVLLLTATPHVGSDEAYEAIRRVGASAHDQPALVVRRTRAAVGLGGGRRVHVLACSPTAAERRLWRALRAYATAVWGTGLDVTPARLAMAVLLKRAASCAAALQRSLAHRRRLLDAEPLPLQTPLPFDPDPGEHDDGDEALEVSLAAPGLADGRRERAWLQELEALAATASAAESKLRALRRLLRRVGEPVVVFTEYRDTLRHLASSLKPGGETLALLHGGLSRRERRDAVDAFARGAARVLLATDVGSEGLNLQQPSRFVVSMELPWSPARLEQRIGRVDRIGQARRVHGLTLVASLGPEREVLRRLTARVARIERALGDAWDVPPPPEVRLAAGALGLPMEDTARTARGESAAAPVADLQVGSIDTEVLAAARRLRDHEPARGGHGPSWPHGAIPWTRLRRGTPRSSVVIVFELRTATEAGTVAAQVVVAVQVELRREAFQRFRAIDLIRALQPLAAATAEAAGRERVAAAGAVHHARVEAALARLVRLGAETRMARTPHVQPGLFDRRALAAAARLRAASAGRHAEIETRQQRLRREQCLRAPDEARPVAAFLVR